MNPAGGTEVILYILLYSAVFCVQLKHQCLNCMNFDR